MVAWLLFKRSRNPARRQGTLRLGLCSSVSMYNPRYPMIIIRKECIRRLQ